MRTTIDIPDDLMRTVQKNLGFKSKRDTVVHALKTLERLQAADALRALAGKVSINLDLNEIRKRPGTKRAAWNRSR